MVLRGGMAWPAMGSNDNSRQKPLPELTTDCWGEAHGPGAAPEDPLSWTVSVQLGKLVTGQEP